MKASNRNLLAIAMATVLLSSAAWAQKGEKGPPDMPRLPPTQTEPVTNAPEPTLREMQKPITETMNDAETTPPPSPPQSQGAEHAARHSSVVERDLWTRLDTDGDGRISATEGEADAVFNTDFAAMDTDDDGFISDSEYRSSAKADMQSGTGGANTSSRSSSSLGDVMRRLDSNADGSISLSEGQADAAIKANFAAIDANSDGTVTRAEYQAWLKDTRK